MNLGLSVPCIGEVVGAFLGGVGSEQLADGGDDGFDGARGGVAQQVLELGEDLFDRVEVGRVFGKEEQLGPGGADGAADRFALVAAEVVHDHQVARLQGGGERLLDIGR